MTRRSYLKKRGAPKRHYTTPAEAVKEKFGDKGALCTEIAKRLDREEGETVDALALRLAKRRNAQLLRLYRVTEIVRENHGGSKQALVDAVAKHLGHEGDKPFTAKLATMNLPRLVDLLNKAPLQQR